MKLCLTDRRSPLRWSKAQRGRKADRAVVSLLWATDPFGSSPGETLIAVQPGVWMNRGVPVGDPGSFNWNLHAWVKAHDAYLRLPTGEIVQLWSQSDGQWVDAMDLTREDVQAEWTESLPAHFNFVDGLLLDYYSTYVGLKTNLLPPTLWPQWQEAWRQITDRLRKHRPDWALVGQEWHVTPITQNVDGLYFERVDEFYPNNLDRLRDQVELHGRPEECVIELREPFRFPSDYVRMLEDFVTDLGAMGSFGMDAAAWSGS